MKKKIIILLVDISILSIFVCGEEIFCTISNKKVLNKVSDKFLSITVDPATLLTGEVNLSDDSLTLAKRLSPAYLRLAGPSTNQVTFRDSAPSDDADHSPLVITPPEWFGVNEWLRQAGLSPVFGLADGGEGAWQPEGALPMLQLTDRLNVSCSWQLGYDCSNKTEDKYKEGLKTLRNTVDSFPNHKSTWKIIASDVNKCFAKVEKFEDLKESIKDLENDVDAVFWQFPETIENFKTSKQKTDSKIQLWTSVSRKEDSPDFFSLFSWIKQIENAAKMGFEVVFTEPNLAELSSASPVYYFSLLHKKLMGKNVLDAKITNHQAETNVYARCTKNQNQFVRRGAITILLINNNTESYSVNLKLGLAPSMEKSMEIQSYILTASEDDPMKVLLNEEILQSSTEFTAKVRRAKISNKHVVLEVPAKSVAFFVLPDARSPVCDKNEEDIDETLTETQEEDRENLTVLQSRGSFTREDVLTLEKIKRRMEEVLEKEERIENSIKRENPEKEDKKIQATRKFILDAAKLKEKNKRRNEEMKNLMKQRSKLGDKKEEKSNIDLTSSEIEEVLRQKIEQKGYEKNVKLTSEELHSLADDAWDKFKKQKTKRAINHILLEERYLLHHSKPHSVEIIEKLRENENNLNAHDFRMKREINSNLLDFKARIEEAKNKMRSKHEQVRQKLKKLSSKNMRYKRDINIDLLKKKTEGFRSKSKIREDPTTKKPELKTMYKHKEEKMATIRKPGQTSEEILEELLSSEEERAPIIPQLPSDIFAELATEEKSEEEDGLSFEVIDPKKRKFGRNNVIVQPERTKKRRDKKKKPQYDLQFMTGSQEVEDIEEDLPSIHEYYGLEKKSKKKDKKFKELWEGVYKKSKDDVTNRDGFSSDEIEFSEEDLRRKKRENGITKEDYRRYRKYVRDQLKVLKQQMLEGKLKNRMKIDDEDQEEKIKQLQALKAKLATKREHFEKLLKEDKKLNEKFFNAMEETASVSRLKRSIFDKDIFGNYKILNNLKSPDITSPLKSRIGIPPYDFDRRVFKNMFGQNKYVTYRRKRSIPTMDSIENEIEGMVNKIHKETKFIKPKLDFDKGEYEFILPNRDKLKLNNNHGDAKLQYSHKKNRMENDYKPTSTSTQISATTEAVKLNLRMKEENMKNYVQTIPKKNETKILDTIIRKITGFFDRIDRNLRSYLQHFWN